MEANETRKPERRKLGKLHRTALGVATAGTVAVGAGGAWGTWHNMGAVFGSDTAWGLVAAAEGAVLLAAVATVVLTVLEQATPKLVKAALVVIPTVAAGAGAVVAPSRDAAVAFAVTQVAMVAAAEFGALVARKAVAFVTGVDPNERDRNAKVAQKVAFSFAASQNHPDVKKRGKFERNGWKQMGKLGANGTELADQLAAVQVERVSQGADAALKAMFGLDAAAGRPELPKAEAPAVTAAEAPTEAPAPAIAEAPTEAPALPAAEAPTEAGLTCDEQPERGAAEAATEAEAPAAEQPEQAPAEAHADCCGGKLLTAAEAAKLKGVNTKVVRNKVDRKQLTPAGKNGRGWNLFCLADVDALTWP